MNSQRDLCGRVVHITGSASSSLEECSELEKAHDFVRALTTRLLESGFKLLVFLAKEPIVDGVSRTFDWTIVDVFLELRKANPQLNPRLIVVSSTAIEEKLQHRKKTWKKLLRTGVVAPHYIDHWVYSGGKIRDSILEFSDIFVAISGGKGVRILSEMARYDSMCQKN